MESGKCTRSKSFASLWITRSIRGGKPDHEEDTLPSTQELEAELGTNDLEESGAKSKDTFLDELRGLLRSDFRADHAQDPADLNDESEEDVETQRSKLRAEQVEEFLSAREPACILCSHYVTS
jgi:hypothetical protein